MSLRIEIDRDACEANGVCEELAPQLLRLDDEDRLHLRVAEVPAALEDQAREAVRACPRQALRLVEDQPTPRS